MVSSSQVTDFAASVVDLLTATATVRVIHPRYQTDHEPTAKTV